MRTFFLLLFSLLWGTAHLHASPRTTAEAVLEKLYRANGNTVFLKPAIEISSEKSRVASFHRRRNTIVLELGAFDICRRFGPDSLSALAFILGHELSHAFQHEGWEIGKTDFLAHGKTPSSNARIEQDADIGGVFIAYLAGYNTIDHVPALIDQIYAAYALSDKILTGYPSRSERQETGREVQRLTRELIQVFETGNYLAAIGKYDLARACFRHVEQYYKGREVYNNLGLNAVLEAVNFTAKNVDGFVYPFELSWHTRLKKPRTDRGEDGLSQEEKLLRRQLLQEAEQHFITARKMDMRDFSTDLNLFSVTLLLYGGDKGMEFYSDNSLDRKIRIGGATVAQQEKLQLLVGIAQGMRGQQAHSKKIFRDLGAQSKSPSVLALARANLVYLDGKTAGNGTENASCTRWAIPDAVVDGVRLHRPQLIQPVQLGQIPDISVSIQAKQGSTLLVLMKNGAVAASLQRVPCNQAAPDTQPAEALQWSGGYFFHCPDGRWVARVENRDNRIREYVKYHIF